MGVIDTLKDAVGLIQKVDNIELYKQMLELQTQVVNLVDENRALKEKLGTREQLRFEKNAYWMNEAGPFCSHCWDTKNNLVRLHTVSKGSVGSPQCPACKHFAVDTDKARSIHQRAREGRTGAGPEKWGRRGGY